MPQATILSALLLTLTLFLFSIGCGGTQTSGKGPVGKLEILNHGMTTHQFQGAMPESTAVVKGSARNVGNAPIHLATIVVNFYDKEKKLLGTASAVKQNMGMGDTWEFNIQWQGADAWKSMSYDIAASSK